MAEITFDQAQEIGSTALVCLVVELSQQRARLEEALHLAMLHYGLPCADDQGEHLDRIMELRDLRGEPA